MVTMLGIVMVALSLFDFDRFGGEMAMWNMPLWRLEMNAFNVQAGVALIHLGIFGRM